MVTDFNLPVSLMELSLLINHRRGSSSKHCCVNNPPLSSILNVSQSSEGAVQWGSSPKREKDTTQQLFWARVQCSSRRSRRLGWGGTCSPYPLHPVGPLVFIGTGTKRPLHRHQHRRKHTDVDKICCRTQREDWMERSLKSCLEIYGLLETARQSPDWRECRVRWQEGVYKYVGIQPEAFQTTVQPHSAQ